MSKMVVILRLLFYSNYSTSLCPSDMVEIDGMYCPQVEEICLYNTDRQGHRLTITPTDTFSCGEFKYPTKCLTPINERQHMHFCIDKYEYPNKKGEIPQDWISWIDAQKIAISLDKRLCTDKEWTLAAEGPDLHPLPYGNGYHRDSSICNFDNPTNGIDVFQSKNPNDNTSQKLRALLVPSGSLPNCHSDYGVFDMSGNIDEYVNYEQGYMNVAPYRSGLKGGHIWHVRNASRPITTAHNPEFAWYETGSRFCKSINKY